MTAPHVSAPAKDSSRLHTLGWAAFLGASWTWCIGMFLPVLLVRDYGAWGWVVFAVPNVVGAAAMGTVLAKPGSSERVAWAHRGAGVFFSVVTIAFHLYWVYWVVQGIIGPAALVALPVLAVGFFFAGRWKKRSDLALAVGAWALSIAAAIVYMTLRDRSAGYGPGLRSRTDLLPLSLVCVLGFALNPYLDLTFHRARQATEGKPGAVAFGVGFGVVFALMILFTLGYAPALVPGLWPLLKPAAAAALGAHMTVQAALTIAFHVREVARRWPVPDVHVRAGGLAAVAASLFPLVAGSLVRGNAATTDEQVYRLFMAFYALVFPAYVWMAMIPPRGARTSEPTRTSLAALGIVVAIAGPMYWMAFINGQMAWLLGGVAVVLLGRAGLLMAPRLAAAETQTTD